MSTLLSKGVVRQARGRAGPRWAGARAGRGARPARQAAARAPAAAVPGGEDRRVRHRARRRALAAARRCPGSRPIAADPPCLRSSFGTLGRLDVSEALKIDFVLVPALEAARPLWRPFATGAIGALVLESTDAVYNLARFCGFELRLPLVIAAQGRLGRGHHLGRAPARPSVERPRARRWSRRTSPRRCGPCSSPASARPKATPPTR